MSRARYVTSGTYCPTVATSRTQSTSSCSGTCTQYNYYESTTGGPAGVGWSHVQATTLLRTLATDPSHFYDNPTSAQLAAVFTDAATKLAKGGSHLIDLCPLPIVNSVAPNPWTNGASVTITGKNFSGTTSVNVGGQTPSSFSVGSDSTITASMASAGSGPATVTTACGTN